MTCWVPKGPTGKQAADIKSGSAAVAGSRASSQALTHQRLEPTKTWWHSSRSDRVGLWHRISPGGREDTSRGDGKLRIERAEPCLPAPGWVMVTPGVGGMCPGAWQPTAVSNYSWVFQLFRWPETFFAVRLLFFIFLFYFFLPDYQRTIFFSWSWGHTAFKHLNIILFQNYAHIKI